MRIIHPCRFTIRLELCKKGMEVQVKLGIACWNHISNEAVTDALATKVCLIAEPRSDHQRNEKQHMRCLQIEAQHQFTLVPLEATGPHRRKGVSLQQQQGQEMESHTAAC